MAYNFDEFFRQLLKRFKQALNDPNFDHPLKHLFTDEDIDRLIKNPPSSEDMQKFMKYLFGDSNYNPFSPGSPLFTKFRSSSPSERKTRQKVSPDANLIIDKFEFGNEVHVLVGTNRTDLEFKTGIKKSDPNDIALIVRDKKGATVQVVKLPPTIKQKTKRVTYQNGTYEIIYQKRN